MFHASKRAVALAAVASGIALTVCAVPRTAAAVPAPQESAAPTSPRPDARDGDPAAASANAVRCPTRTRCVTAELAPIGTPIKIIMNGTTIPEFHGHPAAGGFQFWAAEDVVVNGRLIVVKGGPGVPGAGHTLALVPGTCSITVATDWMFTQDFQAIPVSFGDPRTGAENSLLFPLSRDRGGVCRRSNVEATVYISGPPSLKIP